MSRVNDFPYRYGKKTLWLMLPLLVPPFHRSVVPLHFAQLMTPVKLLLLPPLPAPDSRLHLLHYPMYHSNYMVSGIVDTRVSVGEGGGCLKVASGVHMHPSIL